MPHCVLGLKPSGLITGDKDEILRLGISQNFAPALKKSSASHFVPEDKFLEGLPLLLITMLNSIKKSAKYRRGRDSISDVLQDGYFYNLLFRLQLSKFLFVQYLNVQNSKINQLLNFLQKRDFHKCHLLCVHSHGNAH